MMDSKRNVPFSWENVPGMSKAAAAQHQYELKLPPPPCPPEKSRVSLEIPLPPCAFHEMNSSKKVGTKKMDDPFLIAYKEVTKSTKKGKSSQLGFGVMKKKNKNISIFSCKQPSSCGVADDSVVRLSQLPLSRRFNKYV